VGLAEQIAARQLDDFVDDPPHGQRVRRGAVVDAQDLEVRVFDPRCFVDPKRKDAHGFRRVVAPDTIFRPAKDAGGLRPGVVDEDIIAGPAGGIESFAEPGKIESREPLEKRVGKQTGGDRHELAAIAAVGSRNNAEAKNSPEDLEARGTIASQPLRRALNLPLRGIAKKELVGRADPDGSATELARQLTNGDEEGFDFRNSRSAGLRLAGAEGRYAFVERGLSCFGGDGELPARRLEGNARVSLPTARAYALRVLCPNQFERAGPADARRLGRRADDIITAMPPVPPAARGPTRRPKPAACA